MNGAVTIVGRPRRVAVPPMRAQGRANQDPDDERNPLPYIVSAAWQAGRLSQHRSARPGRAAPEASGTAAGRR